MTHAFPQPMDADTPIRCQGGKLHFRVVNGLIEVKCNHIRCTRGTDIVFHYLDPQTLQWIPEADRRYQEPERKF